MVKILLTTNTEQIKIRQHLHHWKLEKRKADILQDEFGVYGRTYVGFLMEKIKGVSNSATEKVRALCCVFLVLLPDSKK